MNQVYFTGRLTKDVELEKINGVSIAYITVACPRSYKNINGEYEVDFIDCILNNIVATSTAEYCKKGDLVGIKGRIQTRFYDTTDGEKKKITEIVVERVSFLSSKKEEE